MTLRVSPSTFAKMFRPGKKPIVRETRRLVKPRGQFGIDHDSRPIVTTLTVALPMPPSVNALTFNMEGGGRAKTQVYRDWIAEAGWRLQQQKAGRVVGAYEIEIRVSRVSKRRDIGNLEKAISDLLVKHKIISDDSFAERITLEWIDGDNGVEVAVSKAEARAA